MVWRKPCSGRRTSFLKSTRATTTHTRKRKQTHLSTRIEKWKTHRERAPSVSIRIDREHHISTAANNFRKSTITCLVSPPLPRHLHLRLHRYLSLPVHPLSASVFASPTTGNKAHTHTHKNNRIEQSLQHTQQHSSTTPQQHKHQVQLHPTRHRIHQGPFPPPYQHLSASIKPQPWSLLHLVHRHRRSHTTTSSRSSSLETHPSESRRCCSVSQTTASMSTSSPPSASISKSSTSIWTASASSSQSGTLPARNVSARSPAATTAVLTASFWSTTSPARTPSRIWNSGSRRCSCIHRTMGNPSSSSWLETRSISIARWDVNARRHGHDRTACSSWRHRPRPRWESARSSWRSCKRSLTIQMHWPTPRPEGPRCKSSAPRRDPRMMTMADAADRTLSFALRLSTMHAGGRACPHDDKANSTNIYVPVK